MKLTKSLLLASVAGFAAVASAQAADLPSKKAAPVEYVKVCPTYGPGFFYIPGTTTCLKIGGSVDATMYGVNQHHQGANGALNSGANGPAKADNLNSHAEGRVSLDARDQTEYGMARTFVRIAWVRSSGSDDNSGSQPRRGQWFNGLSQSNGTLQTGFQASNAFVSLGGFTAGRTESMAWVGPSLMQTTAIVPSNGRVNLVQYTASLGSGMSLTGAVEDAAELRNGTFGTLPTAGLSYRTVASTLTPLYKQSPIEQGTGGDSTNISNNFPDAVASFDVAQAWGTAKLAAVYHNVAAQSDTGVSSKAGYAGMASVKINLPMLAAGDTILFHGAYALGATGRTYGNAVTDSNPQNSSAAQGMMGVGVYDSVVDNVNRTQILSKSWSVGAEFRHFFAPTVSAYVSGNYASIDYGRARVLVDGLSGAYPQNFQHWASELGVIWSPVTGLEINPSVAYRKLSTDRAIPGYNSVNIKSDDQYTVRLRVARSF